MTKHLIFCILIPVLAMAGNLATEAFVTNRVNQSRAEIEIQLAGMATTQQVADAVASIITGSGGNGTDLVARAAAAYAYSPTNPPPAPAGLGTDLVARAAAAYAYSPTNPPFALTNVLVSADRDTNGWWTLYIITNGVRILMR